MWIVDEQGDRSGHLMPHVELPAGDLRDFIIREGPDQVAYAPTSGNAWNRQYLDRVLPMPESEYRIYADGYLCQLAPIFGPIECIGEPLSLYRVHRGNEHKNAPLEEKLPDYVRRYDFVASEVARCARDMGFAVDVDRWRRNSWCHRIKHSLEDINRLVPAGAPLILGDEASWGAGPELCGRRSFPFVEKDGEYWGCPIDDSHAVEEIERLRREGAQFAVLAWPAFWWLDWYTGFRDHLQAHYTEVLRNDRLVAWDIRARRR
jgi:hypothetical protein